ncbi:MAG: hypothetical protein JNM80_10400 [Phycisphaerae bacterium]|nr:hypothetical protein [Phycisphaerae bacterium]
MNIIARVSKLERSPNERRCVACATERVVLVPDMAAAQDRKLTRCDRCGRPAVVKILVGDAWSSV